MNKPTQTWTEQITAHLELALQVAKRLPANEKLEPERLNKILDLISELHSTFLIQCQLQGFATEKK